MKQKTTGAQRAAQRLIERQRFNDTIPDTEVYTRQRARADKRAIFKELRSASKEIARKAGADTLFKAARRRTIRAEAIEQLKRLGALSREQLG